LASSVGRWLYDGNTSGDICCLSAAVARHMVGQALFAATRVTKPRLDSDRGRRYTNRRPLHSVVLRYLLPHSHHRCDSHDAELLDGESPDVCAGRGRHRLTHSISAREVDTHDGST
jgi:hypothetical protein